MPNEIPRETNSGQEVFFDDDDVRLGLVAEYEHPIVGRMRQFGNLIDFSETPGHIAGPPPLVGEHTQAILADLGYDDAQMQALGTKAPCTGPTRTSRTTPGRSDAART